MTESEENKAAAETEQAEAETQKAEAEAETQVARISAKQAAANVSSLLQLGLGTFATFSGLLYAMGYLLTLGRMRMLGAGSVDVSNQEIITQVISVPLLSAVCACFAIVSLEGLLVTVVLLLVCLNAERFGLYRQRKAGKRSFGAVLFQWIVPLIAVVIVCLFTLFYLPGPILDQRDLLLENDALAFTAKPAFEFQLHKYPLDDLLKLKSNPIVSRQLYGFQVLSLVFCLTILAGMAITSTHIEGGSIIRQRAGQLAFFAASLLVFLQFMNLPFLYGYLVMDTKFPTIQTTKFPGETGSKYRPKEVGTRLLIIGTKGGKHVVYSLEHQQMWRGVKDEDLQPAKQLPETDPFAFANPLPRPEEIQSISGSVVDCEAKESPPAEIPIEYWIDALATLLPADRHDDSANAATDEPGYTARWDELGSFAITTQKGQIIDLDLFEVHDQSDGEHDFYLAFKLSTEDGPFFAAGSETESESQDEAAAEGEFEGRVFYRCGEEHGKLTRGSYYFGGNPLSFRHLLNAARTPEPAAEEELPAEE